MGSRKINSRIQLSMDSTRSNIEESYEFLFNGMQNLYVL